MEIRAANVFEDRDRSQTHLMLWISGFPTQASAMLALEAIRALVGKIDRADKRAVRRELAKRDRRRREAKRRRKK